MIEEGILPLAEAGLPSSLVEITVLPWGNGDVGEDGVWRSSASQNSAYDLLCSMLLCALREGGEISGTMQTPAPLAPKVSFMACHMRAAQAEDGADVTALEPAFAACAHEARIAWSGADGIAACARQEGFSIQLGEDYAARISWVYQQPKWTNPPYMFLNGRPLNCPSPTYCDSIWTPEGDVPLETPGSPLDVACSLLDPKPEACLNHVPATSKTSTATEFCESCFEVGVFKWRFHRHGQGGFAGPLIAALASGVLLVAIAATAVGCIVSSRARACVPVQQDEDDEKPLLAAE